MKDKFTQGNIDTAKLFYKLFENSGEIGFFELYCRMQENDECDA